LRKIRTNAKEGNYKQIMNEKQPYKYDFDKSLAQSHKVSEYPFWYDLYEQFFPNMVSMQSYNEYGYWQQQGIDRGVVLDTSKQILIDEKVRGRNTITGCIYSDIALEYWSSYEHKKAGWVCKPLMADYIAYVIAPLGICYMLPVLQLQQAWLKNKDQWLASGHIIKSKNKGYTTHSVGVRPEVLFPAIGCELRARFSGFEIK